MPETETKPTITFRPLTESDDALIKQWKDQDEDHKEYDDGYFKTVNTSNWMFCLDDEPVFAASIRPMIRCGIQFSHSKSERDREKRRRVAQVLEYFLVWIETGARQQRFTEIIYNSVSPDLIGFVEKTAGYRHSSDEFRKKLYVTTPDTGNAVVIPTSEDADARSTRQ